MSRPVSLIVFLLFLSACGSDESSGTQDGMASYVMGSVEEARRKATEPKTENPHANKTFRELAEGDEIVTFSATTDILLVLNKDGTFEYYGPLKLGDDQRLTRGRWERAGDALHLHLDEPQESKDASVSHLVCPWQDGMVEYPLGRDPEHQVYYRLIHTRRLGDVQGGIRLGGKHLGGD